jgi:hypothetical protein
MAGSRNFRDITKVFDMGRFDENHPVNLSSYRMAHDGPLVAVSHD